MAKTDRNTPSPAPTSGYSSNGTQWATPTFWKLRETMRGAAHEPPRNPALSAWREALRRASYTTVLQVGPR